MPIFQGLCSVSNLARRSPASAGEAGRPDSLPPPCHSAAHRAASRCYALRCAALPSRTCIATDRAALRCLALPSAALRCVAVPCAASRYRALRCGTVRCVALPCAALRVIAPHRGAGQRGAARCAAQ